MTKSTQLLVIVFISTAQLALTLLAVAWLFGWIESETGEVARNHVGGVNRFVADQLGSHIRSMDLEDVKYGSPDWNRLQAYISEIRVPDNGFVSVIDSSTGEIIWHPRAIVDQQMIGQTWDSMVKFPSGRKLVDSVSDPRVSNHSFALMDLGNTTHVIHGQPIPKLGITVLSHQRVTGIHAIDPVLISSLERFSFAVALIIGLFGTILNVFMVKRIVDHDHQIKRQLEQTVDKRAEELKQTKDAIVFGLAKLAESRDNDTGEHLDRIRKYVTILAKDLEKYCPEIDDQFIRNLGIASSLHDIGKVGIPDSILLKPGKLTTFEREIMERHSVIGGECLQAISNKLGDNDFLEMAREVAFWHHEHWNGEGYPHRLVDEQIPISARIVAVADVYDALTSRRPYKRGMNHTESRAIILSGSGEQFDPEVVAAFLRHEVEFQQIASCYHTNKECVEANQENLTTTTIPPNFDLPAIEASATSQPTS